MTNPAIYGMVYHTYRLAHTRAHTMFSDHTELKSETISITKRTTLSDYEIIITNVSARSFMTATIQNNNTTIVYINEPNACNNTRAFTCPFL